MRVGAADRERALLREQALERWDAQRTEAQRRVARERDAREREARLRPWREAALLVLFTLGALAGWWAVG